MRMGQSVQWPERREDVLQALRALGDRDYQDQHWRSGKGWPDLTVAVHWLIDDTFIDQHGVLNSAGAAYLALSSGKHSS